MRPRDLLKRIIEFYEENISKREFSDFDKTVYREVLKIPLGKTISYKDIARKIGRPFHYRQVGKSLKKNPFFLIIPCHRIIFSSTKSGGYNLGKDLKRRLLKIEKDLRSILDKEEEG